MVDYESRWEPDTALTEEVLAGRRRLACLSRDESQWVVADLTARGYSSDVIGSMLGCTRRHVKRIRARVEVQVMIAFASERVARVQAEAREAEALRVAYRSMEKN